MAALDKQMSAGRGGGYGLDAELARKAAANYDYQGERAAMDWISALTGVAFDGTFAAGLKDGTLLCKLLNVIRPGTVKKINTSAMPFKQMENISAFLKGCRSLGVAEHSLFETVDLYEEKDMGLVVRCLFALGSTVQCTVAEFAGPHLGAKLSATNKREFTAEQLAKGRAEGAITKTMAGSTATMERLPVSKNGITMGAECAGTGDSGSICMTMMGSYGIMEREVSKSGITMGADSAGPSLDAAAVPRCGLGSSLVMERATLSPNGITMGADMCGASADLSSIPKVALGSSLTMAKPEFVGSSITAYADRCGAPADNGTVPKVALGSSETMAKPEAPRDRNAVWAEMNMVCEAGPSADAAA